MVSRKFFTHLLTGKWTVHRVISKDDAARIASAIAASEVGHSGELRVVIEGSRPLKGLLDPNSLRGRAHYIFSVERVWDTEKNNGVLLYLCLADRACEIVVDRGLAAVTTDTIWRSIADRFVSSIKSRGLTPALVDVIEVVGNELRTHFPLDAGDQNLNELNDQVVIR